MILIIIQDIFIVIDMPMLLFETKFLLKAQIKDSVYKRKVSYITVGANYNITLHIRF